MLQVATVVAVLRAARQLGLLEVVTRVEMPGQPPVDIPIGILQRAVRHSSEGLRTEALHLLCGHPKLTRQLSESTALLSTRF